MTALLERIAEVERLEKEATQGRFRASGYNVILVRGDGLPDIVWFSCHSYADADYIAALVNLIRDNPGLLMDRVRWQEYKIRYMVQCEKHRGLPVSVTVSSSPFPTESYCPQCADQAMKETK